MGVHTVEAAVAPALYYGMDNDLETAYAQMAADAAREAEALEWSDGLIGDGLETCPKPDTGCPDADGLGG